MDHVKVQEVLGVCEGKIARELSALSTHEYNGKEREKLIHCLDMIVQMRDWPAERLGKSFRWLGYIQGMMHAFDVCDLEALKEMSRPTEEDEAREAFAKAEAKAETSRLADRLERSIKFVTNSQAGEELLRECVVALRGELPESLIETQKATTMADIPPRFRPGARS